VRPVLHGDVTSAARVLLAVPMGLRHDTCKRMIREAHMADAHVRKNGTLHPFWGNGSLMSAARQRPLAAEPGFDDTEYCGCFEIVLKCLIDSRLSPSRNSRI